MYHGTSRVPRCVPTAGFFDAKTAATSFNFSFMASFLMRNAFSSSLRCSSACTLDSFCANCTRTHARTHVRAHARAEQWYRQSENKNVWWWESSQAGQRRYTHNRTGNLQLTLVDGQLSKRAHNHGKIQSRIAIGPHALPFLRRRRVEISEVAVLSTVCAYGPSTVLHQLAPGDERIQRRADNKRATTAH